MTDQKYPTKSGYYWVCSRENTHEYYIIYYCSKTDTIITMDSEYVYHLSFFRNRKSELGIKFIDPINPISEPT